MTAVSFPRRLRDLALEEPDRVALVCGGASLTRRELEEAADALARDFAGRGVGVGELVTIALPNSLDWFVGAIAAWKLGATPQPVSSRLAEPELRALVELARPKVVLGVEPGQFDTVCLPAGYRPPAVAVGAEPLPDAVAPSWKAPTSGGSTGRPKLILSGDPALYESVVGTAKMFKLRPDETLVMPGPLYHNAPVTWSSIALLTGTSVVLLPRFDAEGTLAAIERHRADTVYLVPTMMRRIWALPEEVRRSYDLSSLKVAWHLAEPCPPWLKAVWIDWLGPERIYELYAGTEAQAVTVITGTEWLEHRGSVGRTLTGEIKILDADGKELPAGQEGEVWMRTTRATPTYKYLGAEARAREGGWESLGDVGHLDADGYLYLGDRMQDMVLVGGANVYPAEVEAALSEHPAVRTCAVIGLPDEDKGNRIHAVVEVDPSSGVTGEELLAFAAARLSRYKLPRTIELSDEPLRDDAGKVRRSALRAARLPAS